MSISRPLPPRADYPCASHDARNATFASSRLSGIPPGESARAFARLTLASNDDPPGARLANSVNKNPVFGRQNVPTGLDILRDVHRLPS
jgi:hypothetical protein